MAINNPNVAGDPYSYDLKWLIAEIKKLTRKVEDIKGLQMIKYANPFQWDITKSYAKNTMVLDPASGDVYLSVQAVPYNTDITDSDYWTLVFNYKGLLSNIESSIGTEQAESWIAVKDYTKGDLFWCYDELYRVTSAVKTGDNLQLKSEKVIISDLLKTFYVDNYSGNADGDYSINGGVVNITGDEVTISSTVSHLNLGENLQFGTVEKIDDNLSGISILDKDGNDINLITDVKMRPSVLSEMNIICLGDSFNYGQGSSDGNGWGYYFAQVSGANCYQIKQPSGGFSNAGTSGSTYVGLKHSECLAKWATENPALCDSINIIVIQTGSNDINYGTLATIYNGISETATNVKKYFKHAKVYVIPTWRCTEAMTAAQVNKLHSMARYGAEFGFTTCEFSPLWFMLNTDYQGTGTGGATHYNADGYKKMGEYTASFVNGWNGAINISLNGWDAVSSTSDSEYITQTVTGWDVTYSASIALTSVPSSGTQICGIDKNCAATNNTNDVIEFIGWYSTSGGRYPCQIELRGDRYFYFYPLYPVPSAISGSCRVEFTANFKRGIRPPSRASV